MSNSTKKMDVFVTNSPWGKQWVKVVLRKGRAFYPSFEDLFRIIKLLCWCEDKKYPDGEGRRKLAKFLYDACFTETFEDLMVKYQIPERDGTEIVRDNGANVLQK